MRERCQDAKNKAFAYYGGRGITVCSQWDSFEAFYADMGPRPSHQHSIDRINNDGNYEPGNCRWATRLQQNNNRSSNVFISCGGESLTASEWSRRTGIRLYTILRRLARGLPPEQILSA